MKASKITSIWNNFFYKEAPVDGICLFRILLGIIIAFTFISDATLYADLWGPYGLQSIRTFESVYDGNHFNLFHLLKPTMASLYFVMGLHTFAIIAFTVGFKTRAATVILLITLTSLAQRNIFTQNSADLLLRILLLLMIFAPAANKFSIDAWLAKKKGRKLPELTPMWVHRLIQIQIAVVYVSTVIAKVSGETWFDGSAVYYATRLDDFTRFGVPYLLDNIFILKMLTWSTMLIELSLGTLIFVDELRKPIIFIGIIFHLGIEYVMAIPTFEVLMIACLFAMFKIEEYPKLLEVTQQNIRKFKLRFALAYSQQEKKK